MRKLTNKQIKDLSLEGQKLGLSSKETAEILLAYEAERQLNKTFSKTRRSLTSK